MDGIVVRIGSGASPQAIAAVIRASRRQDLRRALAKLSVENREALILVAAEGLSYEEAAQVCGAPLGTMKSRVHRGRTRLAELLARHDAESFGPDEVMQAALQHAM